MASSPVSFREQQHLARAFTADRQQLLAAAIAASADRAQAAGTDVTRWQQQQGAAAAAPQHVSSYGIDMQSYEELVLLLMPGLQLEVQGQLGKARSEDMDVDSSDTPPRSAQLPLLGARQGSGSGSSSGSSLHHYEHQQQPHEGAGDDRAARGPSNASRLLSRFGAQHLLVSWLVA
jgi:hypothetical protein